MCKILILMILLATVGSCHKPFHTMIENHTGARIFIVIHGSGGRPVNGGYGYLEPGDSLWVYNELRQLDSIEYHAGTTRCIMDRAAIAGAAYSQPKVGGKPAIVLAPCR